MTSFFNVVSRRAHKVRMLGGVFLLVGLCTGSASAQQPLTGGAHLFAPSSREGKEIDAERALPILHMEVANTSLCNNEANFVGLGALNF